MPKEIFVFRVLFAFTDCVLSEITIGDNDTQLFNVIMYLIVN